MKKIQKGTNAVDHWAKLKNELANLMVKYQNHNLVISQFAFTHGLRTWKVKEWAEQIISSGILEQKRHELGKLVKCDKCGSEYSNTLTKCPGCEVSEIKERDELEQKDIEKQRLAQEKEETIEWLRNTEYTSRRLERENRQDDLNKVQKEIAEKKKRIEEIDNKLLE